MISLKSVFLVLISTTFLFSQNEISENLDTLVAWLSGSFSSQVQSQTDSSYRDVRLHVTPIWKHSRENGVWLYIEQAVAEYQDKPYRQRVYHVMQVNDSLFSSDVYLIPDPLRFTGSWKKEKPLNVLAPDSLEIRKGCTTYLKWKSPDHFEGGTQDHNCTSSLRGASYASTRVVIMKDRFISWDRGFDTEGNQVWGVEKGGYIFLRQNE